MTVINNKCWSRVDLHNTLATAAHLPGRRCAGPWQVCMKEGRGTEEEEAKGGRGAKAELLLPGIMDHSCMQRRGIRLNYGVQRGVQADISPPGEGKREISVYA